MLPPADRDERLAFYANHNIGWVARPKHDFSPEGFKRAGRFKKASNMNYGTYFTRCIKDIYIYIHGQLGLELSLKMEKHLENLLMQQKETLRTSTSSTSSTVPQRHRFSNEATHYGIQYQNRDGDESVVWGHGTSRSAGAGVADAINNGNTSERDHALVGLGDDDLEEKALGMAIEEMWEESGRKWRPWAANGRATRIGDIMLLVDSDTVVPEDCLRDAAREMAASPTVAIIQHESGKFFWATFFCVCILMIISSRCHASCTSLFREWNCIFHEAY